MGFKAVYETLREIFPQLDARVLKAVAIEHSKDVDAAANDVLVEVIPYLYDKIISPSTSPNDSSPGVLLDKGDGKDKEKKISNHDQVVTRADPGPSEQKFVSFDHYYNNYYVPNYDKAPLSAALDESQSEVLNFYDANDGNDQFYTSVESDQFAPNINSQEYSGEVLNYTPPAKSNDVFPKNGEIDAYDILPVNNESCEEISSGTFGDVDIKIGAEQPITLVNMTNLIRENGIGGSPNEEHTSLSSTAADDSDVITCERIHEVEPCVDNVLQRAYHPVDLLIPPASGNPDPVSSEFHPVTEFDSEKPLHGSPDLTSKLEISSGTFGDVDIKIGAEQPITLVNMTNLVRENGIGGSPNEEHTSLSSTAADDSDVITCERIHEVEPCVDNVLQRAYHPVDLLIPPASGNPDPVSSEFHPVTEFDSEKPLHSSPDLTSKLDCSVTSDTEEQLICNSLETRSDQLCKVDFLEEMIEAAKNNKKTLFTAMETVINKMKEVEMREKAVEQAQNEAANGGMDIMLKVEELKHMLVRAKEANNMHAGEVYGEKAILATEARELQLRLLNLSDERDKYLQILNEMRQSIEMRLATAEELRNAAEQEKMQKEEYARKALVEQETLMEKVVMESEMLQQEAKENSKLQEFLMNRGRIVDTLQGEISVIFQDVKLLKEKFDERVPFSKSLSSSQTSCILASSASSSQKSTASDSVHSDSATKDASPDSGAEQSSIDGPSLDHRFDLEKTRNEYKALLGDGWDLLDAGSDLDL